MEEQEMIIRNREMLNQIVTVFMRKIPTRSRNGVLDRQDLMQEVALCFLMEARKHGEETAARNKKTLFHALYDAVRRAYPVAIPSHAFRKGKRLPLTVLSIEQVEVIIPDISPSLYSEMLEDAGEWERKIIHMRSKGMTQREIAQALERSEAWVSRSMKRIRNQAITI